MNAKWFALPATGVALALVRWWTQGASNVWTDFDKRLYVADRDLGWRLIEDGPIWLGLDAVALCLALTAAIVGLGLLARIRPAKLGLAAKLAVLLGALTLLPGVAAFASGLAPKGASERPPEGVLEAPEGLAGGLDGLPAGRWRLAEGPEQSVVATISAGGERFEGRFESLTLVELRGDPSDLRQPLSLELTAAAASIDTGIDGRSEHARQLLDSAQHPSIAFRLTQLTGAKNEGRARARIAGRGEVRLMGAGLPVDIVGEIRALDPAARKRLGLTAPAAFRANAEFSVPIAKTKLAEHAEDFDAPTFEIRVNLIFVPEA